MVSPLGIGIGIALSEADDGGGNSDVPNVILKGLATGTLLYVIFFEILQKQHNDKESGLKQLLAIGVGFGLLFGLAISGEFQMGLQVIIFRYIQIQNRDFSKKKKR
jgi:zinc transporter 1/2/3